MAELQFKTIFSLNTRLARKIRGGWDLGVAERKSFNKAGLGQQCQRLTGQAGYGLKRPLGCGNKGTASNLGKGIQTGCRGWRPIVEGVMQRKYM